MHYHAEVYIQSLDNIEDQVAEIMGPHQEDYDEDNNKLTGFWDWYQIGGRWKGEHIKHLGYDPDNDLAHKETCKWCHGTGTRTGIVVANGCNGCSGTGKSTTWPTSWAAHEKDIISISEIPEDYTCYTMLLPETVLMQEVWDGAHFVKTGFDGNVKAVLERGGIQSGYLVTVDYHC